jgi:hypothetical protein
VTIWARWFYLSLPEARFRANAADALHRDVDNDQFRCAFANAVNEDEAKQLYVDYAVPTPGKPLFQAAAANLNP